MSYTILRICCLHSKDWQEQGLNQPPSMFLSLWRLQSHQHTIISYIHVKVCAVGYDRLDRVVSLPLIILECTQLELRVYLS